MLNRQLYRIAVVGATGNVGRQILSTLSERKFPVDKIYAFASRNSFGKKISFGEEKTLSIQSLENFNFKDVDIAFFSAGSFVSKTYVPPAAQAGALVIDNTSYFRMEPDVPLVVPEVNGHLLTSFPKRNIIANPNCIAIPLTVALKPLHDLADISRIVLSTYQSVSGAGYKAMNELYNQTRSIFMNSPLPSQEFPKRIAFNVIPHIGGVNRDGMTGEEIKIMEETKKILSPHIQVMATCVRVPVFIGHSIAASVEFKNPLSIQEARRALKKAQGIFVIDQPTDTGYATPDEVTNEDGVVLSRLRLDPTVKNGLALWIVSDNLRKGAALNAVQIAETLVIPQKHQHRNPTQKKTGSAKAP